MKRSDGTIHKVLLVDDDDAVRAAISRMLEKDGHTVIEAMNGILALRVLETDSVDLVITDVVMPDMEGLEFLHHLQRRAQVPKIIVISGGGRALNSTYLQLADGFGADGTLSKPISSEALREMVVRVMSKAPGESP